MNAETLRGVVNLEKRIGPGAVVAIKALGPLVQFIGNAVCTLISASQTSSKTSKAICFVIVNLIGLLTGFGASFGLSKFTRGSGGLTTNFAAGGISVAQQTRIGASAGSRRDLNNTTIVNNVPWYEGHLPQLRSMYEDSLVHDQHLIDAGQAHYDKNTGHMLTHWDLIMSHIHPIRHSFIAGMEASIWHEQTESGYRKHTYTPFAEGSYTAGSVQFSVSSLSRRQCAQSDTEAGEPPSEEYCEKGGSIGAKGIYSGYDFTGDDDEAIAAHLKLGNDSYAQEVSQLEGNLMFLGNVEAVCENITDVSRGNAQFYIGLRQLEGPDDNYIGYEQCQDVHD